MKNEFTLTEKTLILTITIGTLCAFLLMVVAIMLEPTLLVAFCAWSVCMAFYFMILISRRVFRYHESQ